MDVTISAGFSGRPYDLRMRIYTIENNIAGNFSRYRGDRYAYSRSGYGSYMGDCRTVDSWIGGHYAGGCYSLPFSTGGDYAGKTIGLGSYDTGAIGHDGNGNVWFTSRVRMQNAPPFGTADTGDVGMNGDHIIRPPGAPSGLTVRAGSLTTTCFGVDYARNGESITQDQFQWATDAAFTNVVWTDNGPAGFTQPCTASPPFALTPGTTYYVRGRSYNAAGWGGWSNTLSQTTLPASAPAMVVDSTPSGTGATVTITPPAGGTPSKYTIERRVQGTTNPVVSADSPTAVYNATNLTPGTTYEWRSSVWYGDYQSPWTAWVAETQENPNTNPGQFFSGATPATPDVVFSWASTAQKSQSIATGKGVKGWEVANVPNGGVAVLQRVTGGIYGAYGARVVIKEDMGTLGVWYQQGFEQNSTGWSWGWSNGNAGVLTRTNALPAHSGSYSLRYQDTFNSSGKSDLYIDLSTITPFYDIGGYYRFTAWVYLVAGDSVRMILDNDTVGSATVTTKDEWVQVTFELLLNGSQSGLVFRVVGANGTAADIRVDDVTIERIANPSGAAVSMRVGQKNADTYRSAVIPGALYSVSSAVNLPRAQRMAAEITYVDAAGALVSRVYGNQVVVPANTDYTLVSSGTAPAGAAFALSRVVDIEGPGWSPWLSGEQYLMDGGMVTLAGPFSYFDGSFAPNGPYVYAWEGTPHYSISVRTTVDVPDTSLIDPDCVTIPPPPRPPAVPNTCIDDTGLWRRIWYEIDAEDVREWFDTIPSVFVTTGTQEVRQLRIRYYANPFDRPLAALDQDDFCGEIIVSYLPNDSVLTLDGITQSAWASVSGRAAQDANHLLYGSDGLPADWATLECGIGYYVTVDVPTESAEGNISLDFELATRY